METILDEVPKREPYPNLVRSFGLVGMAIVSQIAAAMIFSPLQMLAPESKLVQALYFLLVYIASFAFVLWYARREQLKYNPSDPGFAFNNIPVLAYVLLFFITLTLGVLLEPLMELIPMPEVIKEFLFEFMSQRDIFTFLAVVIAAPILEELLFRGVILKGLLKHFSPWKAIFWSAFLFGLIHLNPWQFIAAMGVGILMGWLYWQTKSLLPCIFIHFINNGTSFASLYFSDLDDPDIMSNTTRSMIGDGNYLFLLLAAAAILAIGLFLLNQLIAKKEHLPDELHGEP